MKELIPTIIQNYQTKEILMLGYSNEESISLTKNTKKVHFYSRSKNRIWMKGETSKNILNFISMYDDCDQDALVFLVNPTGPTCHKMTSSCFINLPQNQNTGVLENLDKQIDISLKNKNTYSSLELEKPLQYHLRKLNEETCELSLAISYESQERQLEEAADLLYRFKLLLLKSNLSIEGVKKVLKNREKN